MTITSSKKKLLPPPDPTDFIDFGDLTFASTSHAQDSEEEESSSRRVTSVSMIRPALGMAVMLLLLQGSAGHLTHSPAFMNLEPHLLSPRKDLKLFSSSGRTPKRIPVAMENMLPASQLQIEWKTPSAAGGFGAVYFGTLTDGEEVVVKVSYEDEFSERLLLNELHFNQKLQSIIPSYHGRRWASFLGACRVPTVTDAAISISHKRGLVFRRENGLSLDHYINSPREFEKALSLPHASQRQPLRTHLFTKLLGELLCCMVQVHRAGIVHRDVKPDNILLVQGDRDCPLKLIDFGSACDLGAAVRRGLGDDTVDPLYAPPELRVDLEQPHALDVFCAATTALRVLFPTLAEDPQRLKGFQEELAEAEYDLEGWCRQAAGKSGGSGELAGEARTLLHPRNRWVLELLGPMLRQDPALRPTPQDLLRKMGPVWAARLDSIEILAPALAPLVANLGQRLARELRSNPWAVVGVVLAAGRQVGRQAVEMLTQRLPRLSSAISEGTRKILKSVTKAIFA